MKIPYIDVTDGLPDNESIRQQQNEIKEAFNREEELYKLLHILRGRFLVRDSIRFKMLLNF